MINCEDATNNNKNIYIYVDSQAVLKALDAPFIKSSLTKRCLGIIDKVCENSKVTLRWAPGHSNINGNKKTELLARQGTSLAHEQSK